MRVSFASRLSGPISHSAIGSTLPVVRLSFAAPGSRMIARGPAATKGSRQEADTIHDHAGKATLKLRATQRLTPSRARLVGLSALEIGLFVVSDNRKLPPVRRLGITP